METAPTLTLEERLAELFQSLGIARAHIVAGQMTPGD